MLITIPDDVQSCLNTLNLNGFEAYVVGGAVRDSLLNKKTNDWDITSNANPEQLKLLFHNGIFMNEKYGTLSIFRPHVSIEITPFRIESNYTNHRHPQHVSFGHSLHDDLQRRDFTINAMAYDDVSKTLIDPFGGLKDLKAMLLNTVGLAKDRLSEDYLRILRAARFANMLNFKLSEDILQASTSLAEKILSISSERIGAEFLKIFEAESSECALDFCNQTKLSRYVFSQDIKINPKDFTLVLPQTYQVLCRLLKIYKCDFDATSQKILQWSWPRHFQQQLKHIQQCINYYQSSKKSLSVKHDFLLNLKPINLEEWQSMYNFLYNTQNRDHINELKAMNNSHNLFATSDLAIDGKDIQIVLNNPKHNHLIGKILSDLTEQVRMKNLSNDRNHLLAYTQQKYSGLC